MSVVDMDDSSLPADLKPNSITLAGSELVRSWLEPDNVTEFGFYGPSRLAWFEGWRSSGTLSAFIKIEPGELSQTAKLLITRHRPPSAIAAPKTFSLP